jgi:hypothetical protein
MNNCYKIGGKEYRKSDATVTVAALDYASMYLQHGKRFPHFGKMVVSLEGFLN